MLTPADTAALVATIRRHEDALAIIHLSLNLVSDEAAKDELLDRYLDERKALHKARAEARR